MYGSKWVNQIVWQKINGINIGNAIKMNKCSTLINNLSTHNKHTANIQVAFWFRVCALACQYIHIDLSTYNSSWNVNSAIIAIYFIFYKATIPASFLSFFIYILKHLCCELNHIFCRRIFYLIDCFVKGL